MGFALGTKIGKGILIVSLILLPCGLVDNVRAVETRHGGGFSPVDTIIGSNISYWTFNGHGSSGDAVMAQALAEAGVKVIQIIHWWGENITNPIDIFYNSTVQSYLRHEIDFNMFAFNPDHFWGIVIGDEEPGWRRYTDIGDTLSPEIAIYNDTYHSETGYWLKPYSQLNLTETFVFTEWLNEKSVWAYNFIHDYVKSKAPNVNVIQYMIMPPNWGIGEETCAAYELKGEVNAMDCFYAFDNPWLLYESIRRYKASMPNKQLQFDIWGTIWDFVNVGGDDLTYNVGSYEQIRRETWLAYLSGVDVLGWFDWAPQYNDSSDWAWGQQREDEMGIRNWMYVDNLAGQLTNLPVMNSQPEVLVIGSGYQTGEPILNVADIGLFSEYDLVNQRCFATTDVNMSQYSLVLLTDGWHYDLTVEKINEFVADGGNVIFMGGINSTESPFVRSNLYAIESGCEEDIIVASVLINITKPNILGIELLNYEAESHGTYLLNISDSEIGYTPIEGFFLTDGEEHTEFTRSPLTLYHNDSEPDSGYVLYIGVAWSYIIEPEFPSDKKPDLWYLYKKIVRSFAEFLNLSQSISTDETENMMITQCEVTNGLLLAGISNFNDTNRSFNYILDLSRFGYPDGSYWVHSLDSNSSLGQFSSSDSALEIPIEIVANGTRLLLISEDIPSPGYSIEIFPKIPEYIPPIEPTTTTPVTLPTTSTSSTDIPSTPTSVDISLYLVGGGVALALAIVIIVVWSRRRTKG